MLTIEDQARVVLIIAECKTIDEVAEYSNLIFDYVQELTTDQDVIASMYEFISKIAFTKIKEFLINQ